MNSQLVAGFHQQFEYFEVYNPKSQVLPNQTTAHKFR
jgi:hypothetical protein